MLKIFVGGLVNLVLIILIFGFLWVIVVLMIGSIFVFKIFKILMFEGIFIKFKIGIVILGFFFVVIFSIFFE